MIHEDDVFYIGRITRSRGLVGEVEMEYTDDGFDNGTAEYFVCHIDGILVPFYWEEYQFKNHTTAIVKFEHVDNEAQARQLVGATVFYPKAAMPDEPAGVPASWRHFVGYTVFDGHGERIGVVDAVDDRSANILFTLHTAEGRELMIPVHPELIHDYDVKRRELVVEIPDGLLDLN